MLSRAKPNEVLPSNRDLTNREDKAIDSGPANSAVKNRKMITIARDSTYLPQSVLIAANKTMSSRVPSSCKLLSRMMPSCI